MSKVALGCLVFFALGGVASACPDLSGKWSCTNSGDGKTAITTVTQEGIPGGVLYHLLNDNGSKTDWYADGKPRNVTENGVAGTLTVSCEGQNVKGHEELQDAQVHLSAVMDFVYGLNAGGRLEGVSDSSFTYQGNPPQTQHVTVDCARQ
jgi:hypothetical protein